MKNKNDSLLATLLEFDYVDNKQIFNSAYFSKLINKYLKTTTAEKLFLEIFEEIVLFEDKAIDALVCSMACKFLQPSNQLYCLAKSVLTIYDSGMSIQEKSDILYEQVLLRKNQIEKSKRRIKTIDSLLLQEMSNYLLIFTLSNEKERFDSTSELIFHNLYTLPTYDLIAKIGYAILNSSLDNVPDFLKSNSLDLKEEFYKAILSSVEMQKKDFGKALKIIEPIKFYNLYIYEYAKYNFVKPVKYDIDGLFLDKEIQDERLKKELEYNLFKFAFIPFSPFIQIKKEFGEYSLNYEAFEKSYNKDEDLCFNLFLKAYFLSIQDSKSFKDISLKYDRFVSYLIGKKSIPENLKKDDDFGAFNDIGEEKVEKLIKRLSDQGYLIVETDKKSGERTLNLSGKTFIYKKIIERRYEENSNENLSIC